MYIYEVLFYITHAFFIVALLLLLNNKNNILFMFIGTELLNIAGVLNYLFYFIFFQNYSGESLILIMFGLGAAEAAIGLILVINYVRLQNNLSITS